MRRAPLLFSLLIALMAAACARQQPAYYVTDPNTGQPVPVVQGYSGAGQGTYAQSYAPQERGLFTSGGLFTAPANAPPAPQPEYEVPPPRAGVVQQRYGQGYVMQYQPPVAVAPAPAGAYAGAPSATSYAYAAANEPYTLDAGDKLRIVVFGQDGITGSYIVGASGAVSLPLVGSLPARGVTTQQLAGLIAARLKQGYVREPHVTVEVETYRPFFIMGEVTTPGQYAYVPNMTADNAVAIAGGFAPRADKRQIEVTRTMGGQRLTNMVPLSYPLRPGDTVVVKERWF